VATIEQRIKYLFSNKRGSKTAPIATIALIFAERRNDWLTHKDVINLMNKRFADSTIRKAFKELSHPLDALGGHSFIDIESDKKSGRGGPTIRGRLSDAAAAKLFTLSKPVNQKPSSKFIMSGEDLIEIPPPKVGEKSHSPVELIRLRRQKSGRTETKRILRKLAHDDQGTEKEAIGKVIEKMAEQLGISFDVTLGRFFKDGQIVTPNGKLAAAHFKWTRLHGNRDCYAVAEGPAGIFASHRLVGPGPHPKSSHQRYTITEEGIKNELASDENRIAYSIDGVVEATKRTFYLLDVIFAGPDSEPSPDTESINLVERGIGMYGLDLADGLPKKTREPKES